MGPHRLRRGNRQGKRARQDGRRQGRPQRATVHAADSRQQARARSGRRHRRHAGGTRHRRCGLPGDHRGARGDHRRQDAQARQDLPHHGLLGMHLHAQDVRDGQPPQHHRQDAVGSREGRRLRGQLPGDHPRARQVRRLRQVHGLRAVLHQVPEQADFQRVERAHGHPPRHLQALRAGCPVQAGH